MDTPGMDQPRQRSLDFHNPGTAEMVAQEIRENWNELLHKRDELQMKFNEETNQYEAVLRDLNHRITMAEAACNSYEALMPQKAYDPAPMGNANAPRR